MNEKEKWEVAVKLLFFIDLVLFVLILALVFSLIESNNEMTIWMLEHGRIK